MTDPTPAEEFAALILGTTAQEPAPDAQPELPVRRVPRPDHSPGHGTTESQHDPGIAMFEALSQRSTGPAGAAEYATWTTLSRLI